MKTQTNKTSRVPAGLLVIELLESLEAGNTATEWSQEAQKKYPETPLSEFIEALRLSYHILTP